jgi:hypothetical protein
MSNRCELIVQLGLANAVLNASRRLVMWKTEV